MHSWELPAFVLDLFMLPDLLQGDTSFGKSSCWLRIRGGLDKERVKGVLAMDGEMNSFCAQG